MSDEIEQQTYDDIVESFAQTRAGLFERLEGLDADEYLWEPAGGCWTVRLDHGGQARADWDDSGVDPDPAPLTTIAWRMWHIAIDCLGSYSRRLIETTGSGPLGTAFTLDPAESVVLLDEAFTTFGDQLSTGGPSGLFELLGPAWGPFGTSTRLALALHAQREVVHHGAEIALLRDLYRCRATMG